MHDFANKLVNQVRRAMHAKRMHHKAVCLTDRTIFVAGSKRGNFINHCELYNTVKNKWLELP